MISNSQLLELNEVFLLGVIWDKSEKQAFCKYYKTAYIRLSLDRTTQGDLSFCVFVSFYYVILFGGSVSLPRKFVFDYFSLLLQIDKLWCIVSLVL